MANCVDPDQTAENGKLCRPLIRLLRMEKSADPDQIVPANDNMDLDFDQTADNGK